MKSYSEIPSLLERAPGAVGMLISLGEEFAPLTQYITNAGISRVRYTITHFKHHHRVLRLISNRMSV